MTYLTGAAAALNAAAMARAHSSSTETDYGLKRQRAPQPVQFSPPKPALERDHFLSLYDMFCNVTEHAYQDAITVRRYQLDVHELWSAVRQQGGYKTVNLRKLWAATARSFHHPPNWTNASYYFRRAYEHLGLHKMEDMLDAGALTLSTTPSPSAALHKQSETGQFDPHTSQHVVQMYTGTAAYTSLCNGLLPTHHAGQQQQEQQLTQAPNGSMDWTFQSFLMNEASEQEQQQQQQPPGAALHQMPMLAAQPLIQRPPAAANMLSVKPPAAADSGAFDGAAASSPATTVTVASAGVPTTLEVTCGQVFGLYDVLRQRIACLCDACVNTAGPKGLDMSPMEFERHAGWGSYKKWKKSITLKEAGCSLGTWLRDHGLEVLSQAAQTRRARIAAPAQMHGADIIANAAAGAAAATGMLPGAHYHHQQQQQQQQVSRQFQALQWQQVSGELPPSNSLAGMPASDPHTQLGVPAVPAASIRTITAAAAPAMAVAVALATAETGRAQGKGGSHIGSSSERPDLLAVQQQGQHPVGEQLVGHQVEVWSGLDDSWFAATVQAYDPVSQLYLLHFEDGELETLDLAAEQWRMAQNQQQGQVHGQVHGQAVTADLQQQLQQQQVVSYNDNIHTAAQLQPPAAAASAAAAAAAAGEGIATEGNDSGTGADESSWWEAAQRSLRERPLRVVLDSLNGCLRVLPASEIVQAKLNMRQQQQQQPGSHAHWQAQRGGLEHSSSVNNSATNSQLQVVSGPSAGAPGTGMYDTAAGAGPNVSPFAAAAATAAAAAEADVSAADRDNADMCNSSVTGVSLQFSCDAAAAEAGKRTHRALEAACRPPRLISPTKPVRTTGLATAAAAAPGMVLPSSLTIFDGPGQSTAAAATAVTTNAAPCVAISLGGPATATAAAAAVAAAAGGVSVPEIPVDVVCKHKRGTYLVKANGVVCHCVTCVEQHTRTGALMAWSPAEFERHAGMGGQRKWRNSIKVALGDKKRMSLGTWLVYFEQQRMQQQLAAQQQHGKGTDRDQQQQQQQEWQPQFPLQQQQIDQGACGLPGGLQQGHVDMFSAGLFPQLCAEQQLLPQYPGMSAGFPALAAPAEYQHQHNLAGITAAATAGPAGQAPNGYAPSMPGFATGPLPLWGSVWQCAGR